MGDFPCVFHEIERLIFVLNSTLAISDVIIGCFMVVIFSVNYVDILICSLHSTPCMYLLFPASAPRLV